MDKLPFPCDFACPKQSASKVGAPVYFLLDKAYDMYILAYFRPVHYLYFHNFAKSISP